MLAIIAAALVFFYTRGAEQRVLDEQQPVTVLVSSSTIPRGISLGDAVAGGLAEKTQVPADMAPTGATRRVTPENSALLAINQVNPGQILLSTNFAAELPDVTPVSIPDGLIAIAISLGDVQRVGNFLRPGAEVVIFNSYTTGAAAAEGEAATRRPDDPGPRRSRARARSRRDGHAAGDEPGRHDHRAGSVVAHHPRCRSGRGGEDHPGIADRLAVLRPPG